MCTEKYSTRGVSRDKYSTRLRLVLYLSLDTPPRAVFSIHTRGSALTNTYNEVTLFMDQIMKNKEREK